MGAWALRFILWYVCILMTQPQHRFHALRPLHIADIAVSSSLICYILGTASEKRSLIPSGIATRLGLTVVALALLSNYTGPLQPVSDWNSSIDEIVKNFTIMLLLQGICTTIGRAWAVQATVIFGSLWWIKGGLRLSIAGATFAGDRVMGPTVALVYNPNGLAYMMCVLIPIYLCFFRMARSKLSRLFFLFLAVSAVYIALKTGSRSGMLCLAGLVFFVIPKFAVRNKMMLLIAGFVVTLLWSGIGGGNIERYKTIPEQIGRFLSGEEKVEKPTAQMNQDELSAHLRKKKNKHSWTLIKRYPVFGVGINPDSALYTEDVYFASGKVHCEILMAGLQMGFIGMALYCGTIIIPLVLGHRIETRYKKSWPAVSDLGWAVKVQAVMFIIGGAFSPAAWNILGLLTMGFASSLWHITQTTPAPAPALAASTDHAAPPLPVPSRA